MPKKVSQGWIAKIPAKLNFSVNEKRIQHKPTAILIHGNGFQAFLQYAGLDEASWVMLEVPADGDVLRDLAKAIEEYAAEVDKMQGKS